MLLHFMRHGARAPLPVVRSASPCASTIPNASPSARPSKYDRAWLESPIDRPNASPRQVRVRARVCDRRSALNVYVEIEMWSVQDLWLRPARCRASGPVPDAREIDTGAMLERAHSDLNPSRVRRGELCLVDGAERNGRTRLRAGVPQTDRTLTSQKTVRQCECCSKGASWPAVPVRSREPEVESVDREPEVKSSCSQGLGPRLLAS